uniref:Uncharacterized protein n=1 Tax=Cannabis sativa TaxID=3483 RepID=A0A803PUD4_CANSA
MSDSFHSTSTKMAIRVIESFFVEKIESTWKYMIEGFLGKMLDFWRNFKEERDSVLNRIKLVEKSGMCDIGNSFWGCDWNIFTSANLPKKAFSHKVSSMKKTSPGNGGIVTFWGVKKIRIFEIPRFKKQMEERGRVSPNFPSLLGEKGMVMVG